MLKKFIFILILVFTVNIYFYAFWDIPIPNYLKADFLYNYITRQYIQDIRNENISHLKMLKAHLGWVALLDKNRRDDVISLTKEIDSDIENLINSKLKKARYFVSKKAIISASIQYIKIKSIDSTNKEANDFLNNNNDRIKKYIDQNKQEAKKFINEKNFNSAEIELKETSKLVPNDFEINILLNTCKQGKKIQSDLLLKEAKNYFNKKDYNQAYKKINLALQNNPYSKDAISFKRELSKYIKVGETKEKSKPVDKEDKNAITYYNNAQKLYDTNDYKKALTEIDNYLKLSFDNKGQILRQKIVSTLVDDIMEEAVFNYNSQKYEEALGYFNDILSIESDNEIAIDYKARIEKRKKAFE